MAAYSIDLTYPEGIEFYVIGVSPPDKWGCVIPGEVASVNYTVSTNASGALPLEIRTANVSWLMAENYIVIPEDDVYELAVYAAPPKSTPEGYYLGETYICAMQPEEGLAVEACLRAVYHINVTYSCEMKGVSLLETKTVIQVALVLIIIAAMLLLLYRRKFGSTYLKKRKK